MNMNSAWQVIQLFFSCAVDHKARRLTWIVLFNLIAALLEGVSFGFILLALSSLSQESFNQSFSYISTFVGGQNNFLVTPMGFFAGSICLAVLTQVLRSVCNFIAQVSLTTLSTHWQMRLQKNIYEQILRMSFSCASRYKVGDLVDYTRAPTSVVQPVMDHLNKFLVASLNGAALLVTMFVLSPILTLFAVLIFGGLGWAQKFLIQRLSAASRRSSEHLAEFSKETVQTLHGLRAIFTFNRQKEMLRKTGSLLDQIALYTKKMCVWNNFIAPINEISGILLVGIFLMVGLSSQTMGLQTLPLLLTFITMVYRLNGKVQGLVSSVGSIAHHWGQMVRIQEILDNRDKEFACEGGVAIHTLAQAIEFREVSLRYSGKQSYALEHLSLVIPKGKVTALVGLSGAGKSSILDLLLRLYDPSSGALFVDNQPVETIEIESWRRLFGVVSQDVFIFNETIYENICFGLSEITKPEAIEAAKLAGADEFIRRLPQGYQTLVGERGFRLSGGERQRVALARALLRDPEILILDEATSNLDSYSESLIKKALQSLEKQKTLVIVAHRLSTIAHADQIVIVDQGRIKEIGTHEELLEKQGLYAELWKIQANEEAAEPELINV